MLERRLAQIIRGHDLIEKSDVDRFGGGHIVAPRAARATCLFESRSRVRVRANSGRGAPIAASLSPILESPSAVYFGRPFEVLAERSKIKRRTMERRKKEYLAQKAT